jgi:hypothetical protein
VDKNGSTPSKQGNKATNLFLNIIIFLLLVIIIFIGYSIYLKIQTPAAAPVSEEFVEKSSEIIQVEVLNGCGVPGVADKFTDYLRKRNFDVVHLGNYISFDIDHTMVIDRAGKKANAVKVAEALGIGEENILQQLNKDYFLDVSLIIGKDFQKLKPLN